MSPILQAKISTVRRKNALVAVATGVAAAVALGILILAASMILDWWLDLSRNWRMALLSLNIATVFWTLLYAIGGPVLYGPDDDEIALLVEDAEPAFRTRLIASVQLSRENAVPADVSRSLVGAMIEQAESLAGPMDFTRVVKTDALLKLTVGALSIAILGGLVYTWGGEPAHDLLKRAFLSNIPVPRATRVQSITADLLVARGDSVEILAMANGVVPEQGRVRIRTDDNRKQVFALDRLTLDEVKLAQVRQALAESGRGKSGRPAAEVTPIAARLDALKSDAPVFSRVIDNVQESFNYTVELNDGQAPQAYHVTVLPRPAVTDIKFTQVYPAYTGKADEPRMSGDLSLLDGSKLRLEVHVNKRLQPAGPGDRPANFVHLLGADKDVPLAVDPADARKLTGEVPLPQGTTGFSINLTDTDGLRSKDPAVYRVDLVPDRAPTVRIVFPTQKEVVLVRTGKQKIVFEATDDYAVGKASIKYKLDDGPEREIPLDLKGNKPKSFRGEYEWKMMEVQPNPAKPMLEGSVIEYWVEIADTRDVEPNPPGKGTSEHHMIRVGTEAEVREILARRIADIGTTLRTTTDDQENLAGKVQTIVLERQQPK